MADSENVLDWWWGGVQTRDARPSVLSITDGLCSGGHSQRAGTTCLVLGGHDLYICTLYSGIYRSLLRTITARLTSKEIIIGNSNKQQ